MKNITSEQMEKSVAVWQQVRGEIYRCLKRAGDALFNLTDALLEVKPSQILGRIVVVAQF